jgi:hypothetical protein
MTKICKTCGLEKLIDDFHKFHRKTRIEISPHCKLCLNERNRLWRATNKELSNGYSKKWREANKDKKRELDRAWNQANPERCREYARAYRRKYPERARATTLNWIKNNPEKMKEIENRPLYKLTHKVANAVRYSLKRNKNGLHWEDLVGYALPDLMNRLESTLPKGYSWQDYLDGKTDLHIDHIIPITAFNISSPEDSDFKKCWDLKNLRLLPAYMNLIKSNKIDARFQQDFVLEEQYGI